MLRKVVFVRYASFRDDHGHEADGRPWIKKLASAIRSRVLLGDKSARIFATGASRAMKSGQVLGEVLGVTVASSPDIRSLRTSKSGADYDRAVKFIAMVQVEVVIVVADDADVKELVARYGARLGFQPSATNIPRGGGRVIDVVAKTADMYLNC